MPDHLDRSRRQESLRPTSGHGPRRRRSYGRCRSTRPRAPTLTACHSLLRRNTRSGVSVPQTIERLLPAMRFATPSAGVLFVFAEPMCRSAAATKTTALATETDGRGVQRRGWRTEGDYSRVSLKSPFVVPRVHVPVSVRLCEPMFSSFPSTTTLTAFPRSSLESASR